MKLQVTFLLLFLTGIVFSQKPDVVLTTGHTDAISDITMSSDGKYIVTSSLDKSFKIIEAASGRELRTKGGFSQRIQHIVLDDPNQFLGINIEGEAIEIYDFPSCKLRARIETDRADFDFISNNQIVYINSQSKITTYDFVKQVEMYQTAEDVFMNLCVNPKNHSQGIAYDIKGNLQLIDFKTGKSTLTKNYFEGYKYLTTRMEISPKKDILVLTVDKSENGKNGTVYIIDSKILNVIKTFETNESRIFDFTFAHDVNQLIAVEHNGNAIIYDLDQKKEINRFKKTIFSPMTLCAHPIEALFLMPEQNQIHFVESKEGKILKTYKPLVNKVVNMAYDQKGKYLVTSTLDLKLKVWDLELNKIVHSFYGFFPVAFTPDGSSFVSMYNGIELAQWNPETGEKQATYPTENELIQNISFNKDGSLMSGAGFQGILRIWDTKTKKQIQKLVGHDGGIYATAFSPDGKYLASGGLDNTIRIWDLKTGKEIKKIEQHQIIVSDVKFSPDGKLLACSSWDKTISVWNTSDWSLKYTLEGHTNMITSIDFNADGTLLASAAGNNAVFVADNSVILWDMKTGKQTCKFTGHTGTIQKVIFDKESPLVFSSGDDGTVKIWDSRDCKEIATLISVASNDYIIVTPDHYYLASKNALEAVSFRLGDELFPFEQFDLKLNRPDIICSRIGKTPPNLIKAYDFVYQKRLKKMGYEEKQLGSEFSLPKISFMTQDIPLVTTQNKLKIKVKASDENAFLNFIQVSNNGVPQFGLKGIQLQTKAKETTQEIELDLVPGQNHLQFSVFNEKGIESLKKTFTIVSNSEVQKGNLYLITIGVSEYQDARFNLKYAAKDARDINQTILQNMALYKEIKTKTLTDKEVTLTNIQNLQSFLADVKREDMVLIFLAGHGLLDENFDYYFATYDIDFNNPKEKGLPYEILENILINCKANKKMLLMDTCHSGELDKEEVEKSKERKVTTEDVEFRAVGEAVRQKSGFGVENTSVLMQTLFTDFNNETGATVISSSGGAEFAMESAEWKNGLFTYCFLQGLQSFKADGNYDRQIYLTELRKYVYDEVSKLSNGMQKPGTRAENLSLDFRVW